MLPEPLSQHTQNQKSNPATAVLLGGRWPVMPPSSVWSWVGCGSQEYPKVVTDLCYHQAVRTGLLAGWGMLVAAPLCRLLCPWPCC